MLQDKENNLISIDEVILRAKRLGIDLGKGNPRERLRYLTKIGLLPHAKRKSFNGKPPNGAYPEYVIEILKEINEKVKAGKSIQEIKKEKGRKSLVEVPFTYIYPPTLEAHQRPKIEISQAEKEVVILPKHFRRIANILKIIFLVLIFGGAIFFLSSQVVDKLRSSLSVTAVWEIKEDLYSYLLASFGWVQKLVQAPPVPAGEKTETRENFLLSSPEPYLTINAETDINAPLNVKETVTVPSLTLFKDKFKATLVSAELTADRTYNFPDLSGAVCLTTGNCIGIGGEVFSTGGTLNRLAKFIASDKIGDSSIEDLYPGLALTISPEGRVGIGTRNPRYLLHVTGRIQASGDICTDLKGGKCLSELTPPRPPIFIGGGGGGVGGSGTTNYLPIWTAGTTLGNSIISQSGSLIDVAGTVKLLSFQLPTGAEAGYILTSDASGFGTWQPAPTGTIPTGLTGQTLRYDGTNWVANYFLYNTGQAIGIGTTSTIATLTLSGNAIFATPTLPQLVLKYDDNNYLNFAINEEQSLIEASKKLVFNSLTGEIRLGNNVNLFDAIGATIRGKTFISTTTDSTVRKSGELVFRASIPIFRFSIPAQTTSTDYVIASKTFSLDDSLISITPAQLPGTNRVYAFLINFSDNIATTSSSTWRVYRPGAGTVPFTFEFAGQNLSSLETGNPHLTATTTLPNNDWRLEVKVPSGKTIRIFNIFLLTFDQIN